MTDDKKPRRTRGDGGFFQRADGYWVGVVELPPGPDGKRRRRNVVRRDRNDCINALKKLRTDVQSGRIAVTGNTTVAKWLDRWLTEIHAEKIRPTTQRDYRTSIDRHIKPAIGPTRLEKLTVAHIRRMHQSIGSRRAAEKAHVILKKALKDAVREGMLTDNVAERIDRPKYRKQKRTSLSLELAQRIIGTAFASRDESEATRWAAAFLTGARQGELLGLTWDRVDFDNGFMDLSWQLQQLAQVHGCGDKNGPSGEGPSGQLSGDGGGAKSILYPCGCGEPKSNQSQTKSTFDFPCGRTRPGWCPQSRWDLPPDFEWEPCHLSLVWTRPKTAAGERPVPIIAPLLAKLRELHAADTGPNPHNLVWHHNDGRPIGPREDYRAWKSLLQDAGIISGKQTLSLHVARHTAATMLRAAGVDEQTRMEILGHASVDAQRTYAHADRTRHLEAMGSLAALMAPPS